MSFTTEQLALYRDTTVPDLIGDACRLLWVGINPGLWTAATGTHFCHPTNRFYPALERAGIIDWVVDADIGLTDRQRADFVDKGMGISNLVARATVRAAELSAVELRDGGRRLQARIEALEPNIVAVAGVTAFRTAFGRPGAALGAQNETLGGAKVWAVPNPSGLNAHETIDSLSNWYRTVALEAGAG
ncbi:MAG: mismatch-specific DNA-glycosylase [Actinomycetota bacterium]|nr:mismatch-specific DNA-glycosylase [Actinomycetota bacterium]